MSKCSKYIALFRMGFMEEMGYKVATLVKIFGNLLYLALIYFLWKAIFRSSGTDVVNGMTFETTYIYLVLASALFVFMEMYVVWDIGREIRDGKIVLNLLRPMKYKSYLFWSFSGSFAFSFIGTFLPTFLIVLFVANGTIPIGINLLYFVVATILAIVINFNVDFIVGTICIYTESIWGINIMKQVIIALLSGQTIPLAFFPDTFKAVAECLPFRAIFDTPLTILLTRDPDGIFVLRKLLISLFWAIVLSIFSNLFWKFSVRRITVNGG